MSSPEGSSVSFHRVPADLRRRAIERFARKLQAAIASGNMFHCRITTDRELRRLNREFRGQDRATDVLSFPALTCSFGLYQGTALAVPYRGRNTRALAPEPWGFAAAKAVHSPVATAQLKPCPDTKLTLQQDEQVCPARNGADSQIRFVPRIKSASARSRLSAGIGDSPEIGFVLSNRPQVAPGKIGFVLARWNHTGERLGQRSNVGRKKSESSRSFAAAASRLYLGDIAISLPRARTQARAFGHSVEQECGILMLHGLLHLLGMDHETDDGRMGKAERRWRARLGLRGGLIERVKP